MRMSSHKRTTRTPRESFTGQGVSLMAVFSGVARRASACLMAFVCLAQGVSYAQYPNPNYSYLPYKTKHPWAPALF